MPESADHVYNIFSRRYWLGQLDLRPLGFMRIAFGAVLLWSVVDLGPVFVDLFSDAGVIQRHQLLDGLVRGARFSIHDIAGPPWVSVLLYLLTLLAILMFVIGWHSRLASVLTFILVSGLHERNLYALEGSDMVLRVLLFWLMFMPTGARYSVDAVLRAARGQPLETHATALPMRLGQLQIAWIYLDTVLNKWPGVEWHDGSALRIALGLDHLYTRALGRVVFEQQWLTTLAVHFVLFAELAMLPLVFLPLGRPSRGPLSKWPVWLFQPTWKALGLALVTAMHLGIAGLMSVGNFSAVMISAYFLLFEPEWIEWLLSTSKRLWGGRVTKVYYDGECEVCTRIARVLRGFDAFGKLDLIDLNARGALTGMPANLSKRELEHRLHAVDSDGTVRSGWLACARIAQRVPVLAALGFLGAAPGIRRLGEPLYEAFAAHRKDWARPRPLRRAGWLAMFPELLKDLGRGLRNAALVFLMFSTVWFSLPPDGKVPPLVLNGQVLTPILDVSPSRMWRPLSDAIYSLELWQRWDLFPTKKLDSDMYMTGRGQLTDGTQVDVVRGDRGNGTGPLFPPVYPGFFFSRWTEYLANVELERQDSPWRLELGKFICRHWNNGAPSGRAQLKSFKLYKEYRRVPLWGETPVEWQEVMIWSHFCF